MVSEADQRRFTTSIPTLKDPRVTLAAALTLWTVLGQTSYYFNRDIIQIVLCIGIACLLDVVIAVIAWRQLMAPLSAYITGLSVGILLESSDWRVYAAAAAWGILSKHLIRDQKRHFFNPSNFAIVMALWLAHGRATVAPGSQWGADFRISLVIIGLGLMMMWRVKRLDLVVAWIGGYMAMAFVRMALGQGGLVFALGPMTGAEFALFSFSMLPDPKASPPTSRGRVAWGLSIAVVDGILRYNEIRFSMFYSLFFHSSLLPILRWYAEHSGATELDPWTILQFPLRRRQASLHPSTLESKPL